MRELSLDPALDPRGLAVCLLCLCREQGWPQAMWRSPRWGTLGIHAQMSLGPEYRVSQDPRGPEIQVLHTEDQLILRATEGAGAMLDRFAAQPWFNLPREQDLVPRG